MTPTRPHNRIKPILEAAKLQRLRAAQMLFSIAALSVWLIGSHTLAIAEGVPTATTASQHAPGQAHGTHTHELGEPMVDGAIDPGAIPDEVAMRALLQTLGEFTTGSSGQRRVRDARAARIGLSAEDVQVLNQTLTLYHARDTQQRIRIQATRPSFGAASSVALGRYVLEQRRLGTIARDTYTELLSSLTPDGARKLQDELGRVKSKIKIYPTPDMSTSIR